MQIEKIRIENRTEALKLVLDVFMQFESHEYSKEGIKTFENFINDKSNTNNLEMYGAYENGKIIGVIATRNNGNHITLFFVDGKWHKQGIGRKLFETVLYHSTSSTITVNSSPYAVEVYRRFGFVATTREQLIDGIRFTPMVLIK